MNSDIDKKHPSEFTHIFHVFFPLPTSMAIKTCDTTRDFLWDGVGDELKFHWVKWNQVCSPSQYGGLGVRDYMFSTKQY